MNDVPPRSFGTGTDHTMGRDELNDLLERETGRNRRWYLQYVKDFTALPTFPPNVTIYGTKEKPEDGRESVTFIAPTFPDDPQTALANFRRLGRDHAREFHPMVVFVSLPTEMVYDGGEPEDTLVVSGQTYNGKGCASLTPIKAMEGDMGRTEYIYSGTEEAESHESPMLDAFFSGYNEIKATRN